MRFLVRCGLLAKRLLIWFNERLKTIDDGAGERIRTSDLRITNALLYRLSYAGVSKSYGSSLSARVWSIRETCCPIQLELEELMIT